MLKLIESIINLSPFAIGVAVGFIFKPELQIALSFVKELLKVAHLL